MPAPARVRVVKKQVILFLATNPPDTPRLDLASEERAIREELERSPDLFELVTRWAVEPRDLLRLLRDLKPTVIHFSGHGAALVETLVEALNRDVVKESPIGGKDGGLVLNRANGRGHGIEGHVVTGQAITDALDSVGANVRLVVLNACYSASIAEALRAHIDCVIGMSGAIQDDAARFFAAGLYGGLAKRASIAAAFKQGTVAIQLEGLPHADRPQLKVRDGIDAKKLTIDPELVNVPCPYPGMRPYHADEADSFYGRQSEIDDLIGRLRAGDREVLVIGPSGSGKSSLVTAGILPRLARGVAGLGRFVVRELRPGEHPNERLGEALGAPAGQRWTVRERVAALLASHPPDATLLLVLDQLEELFTLASASERARSLELLWALRAERRCTMVFVLRADFFGELTESALWAERRCRLSRVEVGPLRGDKLRDAIALPAHAVGVVFEPDLIERLVADVAAQPGILPLLQETLVQLWDARVDQTLMLADYQALGEAGRSGLAVALARRADATLRRFEPAQAAIARRILIRLISFGEGRSDTRRQQPLAQLRATSDDEKTFSRVLQTMVRERLLTVDEDVAGERPTSVERRLPDQPRVDPRVDLAHEIMITAWPALARWLEKRRDDEKQRRRLEIGAAQWIQHGRGAGGLLDSIVLADTERWLRTEAARELGESEVVAEWIAASDAALTTRRRRMRLLAGLAGGGLLTLLGVVAAVALTVAHAQEAELERDVLATNAYAAQALAGGVAFRLREQVDATVAIAADPAIARALHTLDAMVLDEWRMTTRFDTVSLYDRSGVARVQGSAAANSDLNRNRSRNLGKDYAWRDYFQGARRLGEAGIRGGYISRVMLSESENLWVFGIAAPIYDEGTWVGIVLITVGTDAVLGQQRLDRASDDGPMAVIVAPRDRSRASTEGEGDYVVVLHDGLIHGAGIAVDSPRLRDLRATRTDRNQLRWNVPDKITDDAHRDPVPGFEGRWLAGFAPVGDTGFVVIVQTRYEAALQPSTRLSSRLAWRGSAAVLVWLAACGICLWRFARGAPTDRCQPVS